ncbi:ABC transporter substrate-binding protein [Propionibacteriaceae bacterium Y1685]|uniref:ABC transporter substrate-binding protein n=1 Tax=Microlunatus sp. Y1700 TaxID=3418487 RepID=UPI003B7A14B6
MALSTRVRAAALALTAGLMGLTACAPGTSTEEPAQQSEEKKLTYVYFTDGPDEKATRDLVAQFEQQTGATVTIEIVPFAQIEQTLQARLSGGNAPDVARLANLQPFKQDLLDLSSQKAALDGQFLDGAAKAAAGPNGEILAVPSDLTMNGPIVNKALFEKAGVEVPTADKPWKSWQEMVDAAKKVQAATKTESAIAMDVSGHRLSTMFSQYGTTFFDADGTGVAYDEAKGTEALKMFAELNESGAMPKDLWLQAGSKYKAANEVFLAQQVPVYISGNWQVAAFESSAEFDWGVVPNPCEVECGGFPGGKFMAGFKTSAHQDLAAEFIAFMNSAESQKAMAKNANFMPTRKDLTESGVEYASRQEDMDVFAADVEKTPEAAFGTAYSPAFSATGTAVVKETASMISGQATPEETSAKIKAAAEKALQDVG